MGKIRHNTVLQWAQRMSIEVNTWAPGDGVRRYEFSHGSHSVFLARGAAEAQAFLAGWEASVESRARDEVREIRAALARQGV